MSRCPDLCKETVGLAKLALARGLVPGKASQFRQFNPDEGFAVLRAALVN